MEPPSEQEVIKDLRERLQRTEQALLNSMKECKLKDQQIRELQQQLAGRSLPRPRIPSAPDEERRPSAGGDEKEATKQTNKDAEFGHVKKTGSVVPCPKGQPHTAPITVHSVSRKADAPTDMRRGAAAASGSRCYFIPWGSYHVHEYDADKDQWTTLPSPYPYRACALAVVRGLLTGIGGVDHTLETTNELCCLVDGSWKKGHLPAMPTPRAEPAVACRQGGQPATAADMFVAVIGGRREVPLAVVEVMDVASLRWTQVVPTPTPLKNPSAALCEDLVYVAEGVGNVVYRSGCLGPPKLLGGWEKVADVFMRDSTCSSLCGHPMVVSRRSGDIYAYKADENRWHVIGQLPSARSYPFLLPVGWNRALVVGGGDSEKAGGGGSSTTELLVGSVVI